MGLNVCRSIFKRFDLFKSYLNCTSTRVVKTFPNLLTCHINILYRIPTFFMTSFFITGPSREILASEGNLDVKNNLLGFSVQTCDIPLTLTQQLKRAPLMSYDANITTFQLDTVFKSQSTHTDDHKLIDLTTSEWWR